MSQPTLDELKDKWFLKINSSMNDTFPPSVLVKRLPINTVHEFRDSNSVISLIDGSNYMQEWRNRVAFLFGKVDSEIYHAGWRMDNVRTSGHSQTDSGAIDTLTNAQKNGSKVYVLLDGAIPYFNGGALFELCRDGVLQAALDPRSPIIGSNHQKFTCFRESQDDPLPCGMLGSIDITYRRWDDNNHSHENKERDLLWINQKGTPTHDTGVKIVGPAVTDLEITFRERWNQPSRHSLQTCEYKYPVGFGGNPPFVEPWEEIGVHQPLEHINTAFSNPVNAGSLSIQVLRTYGISRAKLQGVTDPDTLEAANLAKYSWVGGEFTIWGSYLNAIQKSSQYIYIEDQYFYPFNYPPWFKSTGLKQETDIIFQLGVALKRGVDVIVLVPGRGEDSYDQSQKRQRDFGVKYLREISNSSTGVFIICSINNGQSDIMVHSKLMICDDEFVIIGSANIDRRSMTYNSDLDVGIIGEVSPNNPFARELRKSLWSEHLNRDPSSLDDPVSSISNFRDDVNLQHGRVRNYDFTDPEFTDPEEEEDHQKLINNRIDPYGGPEEIINE